MVESQSRALKAPWTSLILAPDMAESQSRALKALWNLDYRNDSLIPENICHPQRNPNLKRIFFFLIWTLGLAESIDVLKTSGSFHVQSPNGLNPTLSEFNEICHTCWFQTPNLKSKIFQWSDHRFPRYGGLIFSKFWGNKGGHPTSKHHIFWTSGPIWKSKVSLTRGKSHEFKPDIIFVIWVNFGVMTFWPIFWPWYWPRGSNYKILITIWYRSPICYLQHIKRCNT